MAGTDGSESARVAVDHAAEIAKAFSSTLHLVMAFKGAPNLALSSTDPMNIAVLGDPSWESDVAAELQQELQRDADRVRRSGVKGVEVHVVSGDPAEALIEIAERVNASLIVVGNRGMTGAKRFLLGSVPNQVSHHAGCTVMIVNTKGQPG